MKSYGIILYRIVNNNIIYNKNKYNIFNDDTKLLNNNINFKKYNNNILFKKFYYLDINTNNYINNYNIELIGVLQKYTYYLRELWLGNYPEIIYNNINIYNKYNINQNNYLLYILNKINYDEIQYIKTKNFKYIGKKIFGDKYIHIKNYNKIKKKFNDNINYILYLIENIKFNNNNLIWCFPKGYKIIFETDIEACEREFFEETNIPIKNIKHINNNNDNIYFYESYNVKSFNYLLNSYKKNNYKTKFILSKLLKNNYKKQFNINNDEISQVMSMNYWEWYRKLKNFKERRNFLNYIYNYIINNINLLK